MCVCVSKYHSVLSKGLRYLWSPGNTNRLTAGHHLYRIIKESTRSQGWWYLPVSPTPRRLRQENVEFEASLGYISMTQPQYTNPPTQPNPTQPTKDMNKLATKARKIGFPYVFSQEIWGDQWLALLLSIFSGYPKLIFICLRNEL